eukprot:364220-Chlamydomonas_euryale.AAC.2
MSSRLGCRGTLGAQPFVQLQEGRVPSILESNMCCACSQGARARVAKILALKEQIDEYSRTELSFTKPHLNYVNSRIGPTRLRIEMCMITSAALPNDRKYPCAGAGSPCVGAGLAEQQPAAPIMWCGWHPHRTPQRCRGTITGATTG